MEIIYVLYIINITKVPSATATANVHVTTAPIGLDRTDSNVSAALESAYLEEAQSCSLTTGPDRDGNSATLTGKG